jgi:parallel beta-helix repeat protein
MVLMFAAAIVCGTAGADTIAVCSSGCDYTTIQAAVNAASTGDTIIVGDGMYNENVDVGKRLTIRSENGSASTIVQAADSNDHVFEVTDDYVSISGFTVTGAYGGGGIDLDTVDYCNISYNNALHNANGIVLEGSDNNTLNGNIVKYNADNGIWLYFQSNNNKLIDNIVNFNINYGIALYVSNNNNMLIDNNASNNNDGIHLSTYSNYNIVSGNTAINNSNYGVSLYSSNSNRIYNNYFDNTNNAYDDGSNIWNTTKTAGTSIIGEPYLGGNYWSGYAGEDLDSDGLGDTLLPYNASENIENGGDWLPLVQVGGAFNIGSIPPQSIWHGDTAEFVICSDELGPGATFSATADPQPLGVFSLDSYTGFFSYTPDSEDKEQFSVTFTATSGNDSQSQTVEFDPMPHLPPEQVAFGLDPVHAVPDPEDKDYLLVNTVLSETPESFNCVVRNTRTISISGKTVVFQDGHNNGLYSYSGSDDIKEMNIYAETVVIRSPLHLPQTNVIIYARELRFENTGCIDTTPKSNTTRPAQFQNGDHGLKAGDIELHIESFYSDPGHNTRFILHGGNGQPAGLGKPGQKGEDMVTRDDWGSLAPPWPDNITYWEVGSYQFCSFFYMGCVWGGTGKWGDQTRWPGDGGNAKPAGKPGNGGTGGNLAASLNLASYVDNGGGAAGAKGDDALGGRGGLPNPAYRTRTTLQSPPCCPFLPLTDDCFVSDSILNRMLGPWQIVVVDHHATWWVIVEEHSSNAGLNAYAPDPDIAIGQSGTFSLISNGISWLHPYAMKMVIAHAKDTYLYGHVDVTEEILVDYMEVLDTYRNSTEWNELDETQRLEFGQMQDEMQILLHRINNNLDYFGNPAGWVPMLSFEVSKAAFEQETDHAIRVLYLCYWIGNAETDIQEKVNALSYAREKKSEEIQDFKDQYNGLMDLIPRLQVEGEAVANQEELLRERLKQREQELLKRAEHNVEERHKVPWWKKATRVLGAICSLCPVGQPVTGVIGGGLGLISNIDELTPWEMVEGIKSISKTDYKQYGKNCEALGDAIEDIPDEIDLKLIMGYAENVSKKFEPIGKEAEKYKDILKETEIPKSEVDTELIKIKANDPEFNDLVDEIAELMARKEALGKQLAKSIQMTSTLSNAITFDLLAIDGMNRGIADGNAVLDHRASAYLKEMEHRETERLLKYHYYMAKAYEYRLLEPYPGELNLDSLFNKFKDIAEAADSDHNLDSGDFNALKALYEYELSTIVFDIYELYQSNPPELSAPIRFNLSQEEIQKLNAGESVTVNLIERGMFPLSDENVRIVKLKVNAMDAHPEGGDLGEWAHMDIHMEHSGLSKLVRDGEVYQFRHYNPFTENPITWRSRYDGIDHTIDSIEPSAAIISLLRSLITLPDEEILIYSRPAAWADITLTKDVNTQTGIDMVIDSLRLEAIYDFTPTKDSDKVKLQVLVSEDGLLPYFIADTKDLNSRQDGRGNFHRTYYKNPSDKVTVKAPASYGVWQFEKWTDRYGNDLGDEPTNRVLELNLGADQTICAQMYAPPIASFTYSPAYPSVDENITFNASSSYDPDGYITNYRWDFGDGNITNTTEDMLMHSYSSAENYMVNLTVTDDKGVINSKSRVITITGLRGDLDNDGQITATDAVIALQMVVRGEHNNRADMDSDGQVTSLDALMILQVAAGAISL